MTNYYLDPVNGLDANDGLSRTTPKQSPANLGLTYTLAAGDEIRVAKDCSTVTLSETGTYARATYGQGYIALSGACEAYDFLNVCVTGESLCFNSFVKSTFTAASYDLTGLSTAGNCHSWQNITTPATHTANVKALVIAPAAWNTTPRDLSAYQEVWGCVMYSAATGSKADTCFKVCLCSDTAGDVIVDTCPIENIGWTENNTLYIWYKAKKEGGGNLGSAIKSIAIYTGATQWKASSSVRFIYNFTACKTDGKIKPMDFLWIDKANREGCFCINGCILDGTTATPRLYGINSVSNLVPFSGKEVQRLRPTYRRYTADVNWTTTYSLLATMRNGASGNPIKWIGGWDMTATDARNGYTTWGFGTADNTYGFVGCGTDLNTNKAHWSAEGFVVCGQWALFYFNPTSSVTTGESPTLTYTDIVSINGSFVRRFSGTGTYLRTKATLTYCWTPPMFPGPGGPLTTVDNNIGIDDTADWVSVDNCVGDITSFYGACSTTYSTLAAQARIFTNSTFQGGETTSSESYWHTTTVNNVRMIGAILNIAKSTNAAYTDPWQDLTNIYMFDNGYVQHGAGTGWGYPRTISNWVYRGKYGIASDVVSTLSFTGPNRVDFTGLDINVEDGTFRLYVKGGVRIVSPIVKGNGTTNAKPELYAGSVASIGTNITKNNMEPIIENMDHDSQRNNVTMGGGIWVNCTWRYNNNSNIPIFTGVAGNTCILKGCTIIRTVSMDMVWDLAAGQRVEIYDSSLQRLVFTTGGAGTSFFASNSTWLNTVQTGGEFSLLSSTYNWPRDVTFDNCVLPQGGLGMNGTNFQIETIPLDTLYSIRNLNRTAGLHKMMGNAAVAVTQTSVRHTPSGYAWYSTYQTGAKIRGGEQRFPLCRVAVKDGSEFSLKLWVKLAYATDYIKIWSRAGQISTTQPEQLVEQGPGVTDWIQKVITYLPNATGIMDFYVIVGTAGGERNWVTPQSGIYWDDLEIVS